MTRRFALSLAALCSALAALLLSATPALAAHHEYTASFGSSGSGDGQFSLGGVAGLAVNESTHDVYVADAGNHRVDEFSSSGASFIRSFGANVGGTGVNACTSGCVAGTSGSTPGAFREPIYIAVDNDPSSPSYGDVYVGDPAISVVSKFGPEGTLISAWGTGGQLSGSTAPGGVFSGIDGIAVNASGHLFVLCGTRMVTFEQDGTHPSEFNIAYPANNIGIALDNSSGSSSGDIYTRYAFGAETFQFSPSGQILSEPDRSETKALAVNSNSGQLFVAQGNAEVAVYGSSPPPTLLEQFGAGHISEANGIAVDASEPSIVYVANRSNDTIAVFEPGPTPTTGKAAALTETSATLTGHVELPGGGETTECYFEWGITSSYYNKAPCAEGQSVSTPADVHADLTGLYSGTTYHYRLVASNVHGREHGEDETFTTLGVKETRTYDSQITGLRDPTAIAVNSADDVWIAYTSASELLWEYGPYPSHAKIGEQTGEQTDEGHFGSSIESVAPDAATGALYVAEFTAGHIDEFDTAGNLVPPQWNYGFFGLKGLAVDNSGGESNGVIYAVSRPLCPTCITTLQAFAPGQLPVDFSAHEPYVEGNEIILQKIPAESEISMAVDSTGNIFLVGRHAVSEFKSSGEFVRNITGAEVPGGFGGEGNPDLAGIAVDPTNGNLLIVNNFHNESGQLVKSVVDEFSPTGKFIEQLTGPSSSEHFGQLTGAIAVNSNGYLYVADAPTHVVDIFKPKHPVPHIAYPPVSNPTPTSGTLNADVTPSLGEEVTTCHFEYGTNTSTETAFGLGELPCLNSGGKQVGTPKEPIASETKVHAPLTGLTTDITYYYRAVAGNAAASRPGLIQSFTPGAVQGLHTEAATNVTATSAELNGSFVGLGEDTEYHFQYGSSTKYGETTGTRDAGEGTGLQAVEPIPITGLQPAATYHYRIAATNHSGTTYGQDRTFTTLTKPSIDGLSSSNLTSTTAVLHATINPHGADTSYHFEYGTNTSYGSTVPPNGKITDELTTDHLVEVELTGLQPNVTYHFRVVAESEYGEALSEDQTFNFYPPNCPNAHLRQITDSTSLPDCRAYELVSPANAGGTSLFPAGPNSPEATNPARFAFGGFLGSIPGGGDPPDVNGDLYVATRTDQGWVTKYVGIPGTQTYEANGPPDELRSDYTQELDSPGGVRTDTGMNRFLDWRDGFPLNRGGPHTPRSFSPEVWSAGDNSEGEWPTVPGSKGSPIFETSADFTHYVFQTGSAPSFSLMDNNTVANTVTEVSKAAAGPIPLQPGDTTPDEESLRVPAVSSDGSHILIAARSGPLHSVEIEGHPCGLVPQGSRSQGEEEGIPQVLCPLQPSQLYMRVADLVTYEIAPGHAVLYVGETPDASKVFFTSEERLTPEDPEHGGASLYIWSAKAAEEEKPAVTLISKGEKEEPGAPGNTANCHALWIAACGVAPFVNNSYYEQGTGGYLGGNGLSDNSIAAKTGDIYFFSPEQLAGPKGVDGQENLYDYRDGSLQYVATFPDSPFCTHTALVTYCSPGPVIRMQVSPDGSYMAFLTAVRMTSYDNAGHTEMYRYQPSTGELVCVSCLPNGQPPTTDVYASSNGLFMTDDGRTFFSTGDPLVPRDTDGLRDVYEYVEGHAQLISSGTSTKEFAGDAIFGSNEVFRAGLVGVSAEGTNVYFSTYDTLVGQDQNANELKFYDARTNGGFPYTAPPAPCEAADECHGPGSFSEAPPRSGSGAELGTGGNLPPNSTATRHKHKHRKRHRRSHRNRRHSAHRGGRR